MDSFHRKGLTYVARQDDCAWVLLVHKSRWNPRDSMEFSIDGGIFVPGVIATWAGRAEPTWPTIVDCAVSVRIGLLSSDRLICPRRTAT